LDDLVKRSRETLFFPEVAGRPRHPFLFWQHWLLDRDSASISAVEQPLRCQEVKIPASSVHGNLELIRNLSDRHLVSNAKEAQKLMVPFQRKRGTNCIGAGILSLSTERVHGRVKPDLKERKARIIDTFVGVMIVLTLHVFM
jgi:hypothetical protein